MMQPATPDPGVPAKLRIHETAEYRVNAQRSIAKPWLASELLVSRPPADAGLNPTALGNRLETSMIAGMWRHAARGSIPASCYCHESS